MIQLQSFAEFLGEYLVEDENYSRYNNILRKRGWQPRIDPTKHLISDNKVTHWTHKGNWFKGHKIELTDNHSKWEHSSGDEKFSGSSPDHLEAYLYKLHDRKRPPKVKKIE